MSEPKQKPKPENKKHKSTKTSKSNDLTNGLPRSKKKTVTKKSLTDDGIAKSKQLVKKLQTTRSSNYGRSKVNSSNKIDELRVCGNGKPMPSLSELEKMFEDSDDDEENKISTPSNTKTQLPPKREEPKPEDKLTSPTTISKIANRMLDLVSTISDPTELFEDGPPPCIIKQKKRKKPEEPYIVGCKDREKIPEKRTNNVFKGDDKFGPEFNSEDDDDDLPKKRAKRGKKMNISKSVFNAKSDEIAARLKECDESNGSSDSNKTVAYELYTPLNSNGPRTFSPLPSTSKDNETFVKNDQRFNESLISENAISRSLIEDDVEVLEIPCETIEINDTITLKDTSMLNGSIIEITDDCSTQVFDDKLIDSNKAGDISDSDSVEVIDVKAVQNEDINIVDDSSIQVVDEKPGSPIMVEDYYHNLDIENIPNDDICDVIDVDDIIAQNKAIIEKYSITSNLDTVTLVDTSDLNTTRQSNQIHKTNDSKCEETEKNTNLTENNINRNNTNLSINEQPSVIATNAGEFSSHRPINVENINEDILVDVEVINDTNECPSISDNRPLNNLPVQTYDLGSPIQCIPLRNNQHLGASQQGNHITEISVPEQQCHCPHGNPITSNPLPRNLLPRYHPHLPGTVLRMRNDTCDANCVTQESISTQSYDNDYDSTCNNSSYQQQMKILSEFFRSRQRNGEIRSRKKKKKNPRLSDNLLSQDFMSLLQSMANTSNNRSHPINNIPSPAMATNSPDKTSKRIGDCPICMDSLSNKPIVSTICGHVFCMDCIKLSIRSNGNKCPTCRKALKKGTGYHQIFL